MWRQNGFLKRGRQCRTAPSKPITFVWLKQSLHSKGYESTLLSPKPFTHVYTLQSVQIVQVRKLFTLKHLGVNVVQLLTFAQTDKHKRRG